MILSNHLIFLAAESPAMANATGDFGRRIFIIIRKEADSGENRTFVTKVLAAAQLNLAQDTMLSEIPPGEARTIATDLREKKPMQVLVFGIPAEQLGLHLQTNPYQPLSFCGAQWLFADALSVIAPDKNKKTLLWGALQKMFLSN
ncbi:MAG: hypothetical protein SFV22_03970 [Saprospiraceae bacterium]|nr:hypothetical protein [Saprospiraceae bacterium]